MRLLFYTATAAFITLAGIFAFYAFQTPSSTGGTKVVLSIDSSDPRANSDTLAALDRAFTGPGEAVSSTPTKEEAVDSPPAKTPDRLDAGLDLRDSTFNFREYGDTGSQSSVTKKPDYVSDRLEPGPLANRAEDPVQPGNEDESQAGEDPILPGTTIANLDSGGPFVLTDPSALSASSGSTMDDLRSPDTTPNAAAEAKTDVKLSALAETAEPQDRAVDTAQDNRVVAPDIVSPVQATVRAQPLTAADTPPAAADASNNPDAAKDPKLRAEFDAFMATLNDKQAKPVETDTNIPAPFKRPGNIPAPVKTAANSWAGAQQPLVDAAAQKSPRVAIVLRGLGRDERNSRDAVTKLPSAISMAFMPYAGPAQQWSQKAREKGHEVIIQLPLEPSDYPANDPGPETLVVGAGSDENISRMRSILSRFDGYSGVTNFLGGRLLQSPDAMRPILESIKSQGLIYVGEANNSHAVVRRIAAEIGLRYGNGDIVIDASPAPDAINKALDELVALSRKQGTAIGIGFASRNTIEQLESWSKSLSAKGVTLVPIGAVAQTPGAS